MGFPYRDHDVMFDLIGRSVLNQEQISAAMQLRVCSNLTQNVLLVAVVQKIVRYRSILLYIQFT